jgi:membrane-bound lytic murein transglycosylase B
MGIKPIIRFFVLTTILLISTPFFVYAQDLTPSQKAQLEQELAQVEAEQKQAEAELATAQAQSASLSRDIKILDAKIKAAQLDIKAKNLLIQTLGNDITNKQNHIANLETHIEKGKETLAQILRKTNEIDQNSLPELMLSQSSITSFFQDIDSFDSVRQSLQTTFEQLRNDEASTTAEKNVLDIRRNAEIDARYSIQQQQKNIQSDQKSKQQLLTASKSNEKSYSTLLAEKRARAAEIRAALFSLRDAAAIPFGQALQYATMASQKTGIRPAYLLAILTQESSLGSNVGTCYLSNPSTGDGINVKTNSFVSKVMNPSRDVSPFNEILRILGGDPLKTVVSCPQSIGWGGAMGPAQFIPSTWMLIKDRLASFLGISGMPDPWNPAHAFMAAGLYLSDRGAVAGSYSAERNAACKYYSGSSCGVSGNSYYGNSVMALADNIQRTMIDPLQGL